MPTAEIATSNPTSSAGRLAAQLAGVTVGLRRDLAVSRQLVAGEPRYVVHDAVAFRNHVFTATEYRTLGALAAQRPLGQTFAELQGEGLLAPGDEAEFYGFVVGLHGMGLLHLPGFPAAAMQRRQQARRRAARPLPLRLLLGLKLSLGSPDRLLRHALAVGRLLFSPVGALLWLLLMAAVVWQCGGRFGELFGQPTELLALANLPILWCCLVALKALHECGHGLAIKRFHGAVPEWGLLLVMLTPCAYVDANASWTFGSRWHRIVVALAGVYVETIVAGIAAMVWAGSQPGLVHDVARNVVVLASISTLLVNANPLVRFDGYYLMSDLLGLLNLQQRAMRFLRGHLEHWLLGLPRPATEESRRDCAIYVCYAPLSVLYRIGVAFGITALMLTMWPSVGLLLCALFGWLLLAEPVLRLLGYLWRGERTAPVRLRARCAAVAALMLAAAAFTLLPVSREIVVPGVLDPGIRRTVRAPGSGFVEQLLVREAQRVEPGTVLCRLHDATMTERLQETEAEAAIVEVQRDAAELADPTAAATYAARLEFLHQRVGELRARVAALAVEVPVAGIVVGATAVVPGRYVRQGDELLQVHSEHSFVRIVLTDVELARADLEIGSEVELRWSCAPGESVRAVVKEICRSASRHRVPVELTMAAGGRIYARATGSQTEADQPYLHVFLAADSVPLVSGGTGLTAAVRIPARMETLGDWARRRLLHLFRNWSMS